MSENVYGWWPDDWSPTEVQAAFEAYLAAPEDATVGELVPPMIAARDVARAPVITDYTREELISICEAAVVPQEGWSNRDTASAQKGLGQAWALLKAGCDFRIMREGRLNTDSETIWIEIDFQGFGYFDYADDVDTERFYLPTRSRLAQSAGKDWY